MFFRKIRKALSNERQGKRISPAFFPYLDELIGCIFILSLKYFFINIFTKRGQFKPYWSSYTENTENESWGKAKGIRGKIRRFQSSKCYIVFDFYSIVLLRIYKTISVDGTIEYCLISETNMSAFQFGQYRLQVYKVKRFWLRIYWLNNVWSLKDVYVIYFFGSLKPMSN